MSRGRSKSRIGRVYRLLKGNRAAVGVLLAIVGFGLFTSGMSDPSSPVFTIGAMMTAVGVLAFYTSLKTAYCQSCGQRLGKLPQRKCERCGSNRIERRDPGASGVAPTRRRR